MQAVRRKQDKDNEVGNQQRVVKSVRVIKALKSLVEKMLAEVGAEALGAVEGERRCEQTGGCAGQQVCLSVPIRELMRKLYSN